MRQRTSGVHAATATTEVQSTLLGELLEHAQIAAIVVDDDGRYVAVNRYACELVGWGRDELLGRRVGELNPHTDLPAHVDDILAGRREEGELPIRTKSGRTVRVHYRAARTSLARLPFIVAFFWRADAGR